MLAVVFGTGRSGTTMVQEALVRHDATGFVSNLEDKVSLLPVSGRWNSRIYRRVPPKDPGLRPFKDRRRMWEHGRFRLAPSEAWSVMDRQVSTIWSKPCRDLVAADATPWLQDRFRTFFEQRQATQRCEVLVAHWTGWPRAGFADAAVPGTKFIHVVRDGRAVANSWLQMGWWDGYRGPDRWYLGDLTVADREAWEQHDRSFVALAGIGWRMLMHAFEHARTKLGDDQWLEVRYEDVLDEPDVAFDRILSFLGLEWTDEFEQGYRRHAFPQTRRAAYRRDLAVDDVALLDHLLGPTLERYGYGATAAG